MSDLIRKQNHNDFSASSLVSSMGQFFNNFFTNFATISGNNAIFFNYAVTGLVDQKDKAERLQAQSYAAADAAQEAALGGYQARMAFAARIADLVKAQKSNETLGAASAESQKEAVIKESEARLAFSERLAGGKAIFDANALDAKQAVSKVNGAYVGPEYSLNELNLSGLVSMQERHDFEQQLAGVPSEAAVVNSTKSNAAQVKAQNYIKALAKQQGVSAAQVQANGYVAAFGNN